MERCPFCGSDAGLYRNYVGKQYYNWDGSEAGFFADGPEVQSVYAMCLICGRRFNLARLERLANEKGKEK